VSEVIGYILTFFVSFLLLVVALYGFNVVADRQNDLAVEAHFRDIAQRVAGAVLAAAEVGLDRARGDTSAPSQALTHIQHLRVPLKVRGESFSVRLTDTAVEVVANRAGGIEESAPLFNLRLPTAPCATTDAVCTVGGLSTSASGAVVVTLTFDRAGPRGACTTSPANCITLS